MDEFKAFKTIIRNLISPIKIDLNKIKKEMKLEEPKDQK